MHLTFTKMKTQMPLADFNTGIDYNQLLTSGDALEKWRDKWIKDEYTKMVEQK